MGDRDPDRQVIMNLVRNGLEAMEETPDDDRSWVSRPCGMATKRSKWMFRDCGKGIGGRRLEKSL